MKYDPETPTFDHFRRMAQGAGLEAIRLELGKWLLTGGKFPVVFDLTNRNRGTVRKSIRAALGRRSRGGSRKMTKKWKTRFLATDPHCYWCRKTLYSFSATIDHKVPVSKGGSNRKENICLSCRECNESRGNQVATGVKVRRGGLDF